MIVEVKVATKYRTKGDKGGRWFRPKIRSYVVEVATFADPRVDAAANLANVEAALTNSGQFLTDWTDGGSVEARDEITQITLISGPVYLVR